jgi:hypothetical protein
MRPEQEEAVNKTIAYFKSFKKKTLIKPRIFSGMLKCDLEKPLPVINWLKKWVGRKSLYLLSNQPCKVLG